MNQNKNFFAKQKGEKSFWNFGKDGRVKN